MTQGHESEQDGKAQPNHTENHVPINLDGDTGASISPRRSFMKKGILTASALSLGFMGSQSVGASTERHGVKFDRVVNLVDDYGADPTGSEPVDGAIKEAASADTLVKVPDGEYLFSGEVLVSPPGNVGFLAEDGASPTFVAPKGHNDYLLNVYHLPKALFEGIDIDTRQTDTTAGLRFDIEDRVHVEGVEYLGRGTHPDDRVVNALSITVTNGTGTGLLRDVTALKGSAIGHYKGGKGRVGVYIGQGNYGTVRIEDCHLEEFGNNGLYCSRTPGTVEVIGGTYRNNNVAGVRIGGSTSFVDGAEIEVDLDKYDGPMTLTDDAYNTRAVILEQRTVTKTPGAQVRNCDIHIKNADVCMAAIHIKGHTGERLGYVQNTRVQVDVDGVPAVYADESQLVMDGASLTGAAADKAAVVMSGTAASESTVKNTCIEQPTDVRNGVRVKDATGCLVSDTNVNVTGEEFVLENSTLDTSNITYNDTCPIPQIGLSISTGPATDIGGSYATLTGELTDLGGADTADVYFEWGESGAGLSNTTTKQSISTTGSITADISGLKKNKEYAYRIVAETSSGDVSRGESRSFTTLNPPNALTISGTGEKVEYEFTVSGELVHGDGDPESNDVISGSTATGVISTGDDSYDFSGNIIEFSYSGPVTVTLNGETFPASKWKNLPNSIVFDGTAADTAQSYKFVVSETLVPDPTVGSAYDNDDVSDNRVQGQVNGDIDAFRYAGEIKMLKTEENISVRLEDNDA